MTEDAERQIILSKNTLIPLGIVIGAASTVFLAGFYVAKLSAGQDHIAAKLVIIEKKLDSTVSRRSLNEWVRLSRALNGDKLVFPEIPSETEH